MEEGCAIFFRSDPINFGDFTSENSEKLNLEDSADFVEFGKCHRGFYLNTTFSSSPKKYLESFRPKTFCPQIFLAPNFNSFFIFFRNFIFDPKSVFNFQLWKLESFRPQKFCPQICFAQNFNSFFYLFLKFHFRPKISFQLLILELRKFSAKKMLVPNFYGPKFQKKNSEISFLTQNQFSTSNFGKNSFWTK